MKFVIINQHRGNYGDEAAGTAAVQQIKARFPSSTISIVYRSYAGKDRHIPHLGPDVQHHLNILSTKVDFFLVYFSMALGQKVPRRLLSPGANEMFDMFVAADHVVVAPSGANIGFLRDWEYLARVLIAIYAGRLRFFI